VEEKTKVEDYAGDARALAQTLPEKFPSSHDVVISGGVTVFLTGATGFLGAYILRDLLRRSDPQVKKVITHVRASDAERGLSRVKKSCEAYGVWDDSWAKRIDVVTGELGQDRLGLGDEDYKKVLNEVDVIIHNGAQVNRRFCTGRLVLMNGLTHRSIGFTHTPR
jgi:L-aminoadipate-semialdehyde dehydrogenase